MLTMGKALRVAAVLSFDCLVTASSMMSNSC